MSYATRFEQTYRTYAMWAFQDVPKWASFFEVPLDIYDLREIKQYQWELIGALKLIEPYMMKCVRNPEDYVYCCNMIEDCIEALRKDKDRYQPHHEEHAQLYECLIKDLDSVKSDMQGVQRINSLWEESDDE